MSWISSYPLHNSVWVDVFTDIGYLHHIEYCWVKESTPFFGKDDAAGK
ncbi:hypothetical protein [Peribacillus frigoritolerans]|uniref:Uncharacterized protein n=1 Tax=Peribacillus castrilensis TaxID=2897690 RepID=A0AAW9NDP3_9BACI|nr:hypothetical protein [Peribacillus castrilensis]MEC0297318.1 hypothetical protein [Peribacillus castrilensis]MEC0343122.1 hypothetical protein [Peribacillus castrilensis]